MRGDGKAPTRLRDSRFELLLSAREKQRYGDAARKRGITLVEYIRRHVEEGWSLENALELQVEDERRRQAQRRLAGEAGL